MQMIGFLRKDCKITIRKNYKIIPSNRLITLSAKKPHNISVGFKDIDSHVFF